jgi:hypothetical protein
LIPQYTHAYEISTFNIISDRPFYNVSRGEFLYFLKSGWKKQRTLFQHELGLITPVGYSPKQIISFEFSGRLKRTEEKEGGKVM